MLDKHGYRDQVLPHFITPFTRANRVAGPAFTGQGYPCADGQRRHRDPAPNARQHHSRHGLGLGVRRRRRSAHWGEIMSTAARERGCTGAVLDGGVRDLDFIDAMNYPVFAQFKSPASSIGRWEITEYQVPIQIGATVIRPGDFVFGDVDGVVIVPGELTLEVLLAAENVYEREKGMREELRRGASVKDAYAKYGSL